jgi:hypothetical protein
LLLINYWACYCHGDLDGALELRFDIVMGANFDNVPNTFNLNGSVKPSHY